MSVEYSCHKIFHNTRTERVSSTDNVVKTSVVESGSALVSMRVRIQIFISIYVQIRIRILGAKPMRIFADPDPSETLMSQNVEFFHNKKIYSHSHQGIGQTYLRRYECLFEGQETRFIC
jgi:hypothetical protein